VTHRFFVDDEIPEEPVLRGDQAHQIANVLHLRPGELITLARNGVEAIVELQMVEGDEARGRVIRRGASEAELPFNLTLALPLLKGDHDEEVVEAVTQLGVHTIVPFVSARSVVRSLRPAKRERWRRIAREAAETARRGRVSAIEEPRDWSASFSGCASAGRPQHRYRTRGRDRARRDRVRSRAGRGYCDARPTESAERDCGYRLHRPGSSPNELRLRS